MVIPSPLSLTLHTAIWPVAKVYSYHDWRKLFCQYRLLCTWRWPRELILNWKCISNGMQRLTKPSVQRHTCMTIWRCRTILYGSQLWKSTTGNQALDTNKTRFSSAPKCWLQKFAGSWVHELAYLHVYFANVSHILWPSMKLHQTADMLVSRTRLRLYDTQTAVMAYRPPQRAAADDTCVQRIVIVVAHWAHHIAHDKDMHSAAKLPYTAQLPICWRSV